MKLAQQSDQQSSNITTESTSDARKEKSNRYRCFNCGKIGHRSFECNALGAVNTLSGNSIQKSGLIFKEIFMNNCKCIALIDSGCDLCIARYSTYERIGCPTMINEIKSLRGIGEKTIETKGYFLAELCVDDVEFKIQVHVVEDNDIYFDVMLGNSVLEFTTINISEGSAIFKKKEEESHQDNFMALSSIDISHSDLDLNHLHKNIQDRIRNMVSTYAPNPNPVSPIEMKIILKDDVPVSQRPRRVSTRDQEIINEQVSKWLEERIIRQSWSEYSSPIVLAPKKDGTKRLCCDYMKLNEKIIRKSGT